MSKTEIDLKKFFLVLLLLLSQPTFAQVTCDAMKADVARGRLKELGNQIPFGVEIPDAHRYNEKGLLVTQYAYAFDASKVSSDQQKRMTQFVLDSIREMQDCNFDSNKKGKTLYKYELAEVQVILRLAPFDKKNRNKGGLTELNYYRLSDLEDFSKFSTSEIPKIKIDNGDYEKFSSAVSALNGNLIQTLQEQFGHVVVKRGIFFDPNQEVPQKVFIRPIFISVTNDSYYKENLQGMIRERMTDLVNGGDIPPASIDMYPDKINNWHLQFSFADYEWEEFDLNKMQRQDQRRFLWFVSWVMHEIQRVEFGEKKNRRIPTEIQIIYEFSDPKSTLDDPTEGVYHGPDIELNYYKLNSLMEFSYGKPQLSENVTIDEHLNQEQLSLLKMDRIGQKLKEEFSQVMVKQGMLFDQNNEHPQMVIIRSIFTPKKE
ncbi:MAG: hypothetical protein R3A11_05920 [Bdellovibrionota bacterium]